MAVSKDGQQPICDSRYQFKDNIIMPGHLTVADEDATRVIALRAETR